MELTSVFRAAAQSLNGQTFAPNGTAPIELHPDVMLKRRLRPLVFFIRLLVLVLLAWSAGNGFLFASAALQELIGQKGYALTGALAFAALFEAGKYFFGAYTLRVLIRGWWREGMLYRLALVLLIPVAGAWFTGSYWLSTQGGIEGLRLTVSKPVIDAAPDTLTQQPNPDIEALRLARDSVYRQAIDRSSPRTAARLFLAFQHEITRMETVNAESRKAVKQQDDQHKQRLQTRLEQVLTWLSHLGGWSELLTLALLVFLEIYAHRTQFMAKAVREMDRADADLDLSVNYLKQRIRQCWKRAHQEHSSERTRQKNLDKTAELVQKLRQVGIQVHVDATDPQIINFTHEKQPLTYDFKRRKPKIRT